LTREYIYSQNRTFWTRKRLGLALRIEVDTSLPGLRVVRVLKRQGRKPEAIVIEAAHTYYAN
jgi:hypothetical protein